MATTKKVAVGQITIVDLNDAKSIQAFTEASKGSTQIFNPDTKAYAPDYVSDKQVLTAKVYVTGNSADQGGTARCSDWHWYKTEGTGAETEITTTTWDFAKASNKLTIAKNIPSGNHAVTLRWTCLYKETSGDAGTLVQGLFTINLTKSGGAMGMVQIEQPKGADFDAANGTTSLTATARLYRGSVIDKTVSAKWFRLNISTATWEAVAASKVSWDAATGVSTLTVDADDVLNFQSFRCEVTDTENVNEKFSAMCTFRDMTDPYVVEVGADSTSIKNGQGSTRVWARVWRDGVKIEDHETADADRKFEYTWTKYDGAGTATNWNGTTSPKKMGNPLTVTAADVDSRATFYCEVTEKGGA